MDFTKTSPSKCKVRSIIKFLTVKNKSGAEIQRRFGVWRRTHYECMKCSVIVEDV